MKVEDTIDNGNRRSNLILKYRRTEETKNSRRRGRLPRKIGNRAHSTILCKYTGYSRFTIVETSCIGLQWNEGRGRVSCPVPHSRCLSVGEHIRRFIWRSTRVATEFLARYRRFVLDDPTRTSENFPWRGEHGRSYFSMELVRDRFPAKRMRFQCPVSIAIFRFCLKKKTERDAGCREVARKYGKPVVPWTPRSGFSLFRLVPRAKQHEQRLVVAMSVRFCAAETTICSACLCHFANNHHLCTRSPSSVCTAFIAARNLAASRFDCFC